MSEPTLYREHFTPENEPAKGEEGWIYAGTDDEFGVLDRWMVPVEVTCIGWCFTHHRIPEDADLCGDEWRDIGPCDFGKALVIRAYNTGGIVEDPSRFMVGEGSFGCAAAIREARDAE